MACLLVVAYAAEDLTAEESSRWRANGWGRHSGGGWYRVRSTPWGLRGRSSVYDQDAQAQNLNIDPNWSNPNIWNDPSWSTQWSNSWGNNWANTWGDNWNNWNQAA